MNPLPSNILGSLILFSDTSRTQVGIKLHNATYSIVCDQCQYVLCLLAVCNKVTFRDATKMHLEIFIAT